MAVKIRDSEPKVLDAEVFLIQNEDDVLLKAKWHCGDAAMTVLRISNKGIRLISDADGCGIETDENGRVKII